MDIISRVKRSRAVTRTIALVSGRTDQARPKIGPDGFQELEVVVQGRYRPDTLVVRQGVPARIHFLRLEDNPCSDWVTFSDIGVHLLLPPFKKATASFLPEKPGEFLFTCRMGIYRGKLLVLPSRQSQQSDRNDGQSGANGDPR